MGPEKETAIQICFKTFHKLPDYFVFQGKQKSKCAMCKSE